MNDISILIGADIVPTASNVNLFANGDINKLFGEELVNMITQKDFCIFNLESPLCDLESPIPKCGPNLCAPESTIKGIKAISPSLLCLANNHIMDQGEQGLISTIKLLNEYGIHYVGAGVNLQAASKPFIWEKNNIKIGVYACAEHEFSIATEDSPGANPFDPLESLDHINKLKAECDYVIILYHGGKEYYRYPSPYLQKVCRKMTEKGADLIVCQHSHCVGSYEVFNSAFIVYGQGNFIFDASDNEHWQTSLLLDYKISKNACLDYIPIIKEGNCVRIAPSQKAKEIIGEFEKRSAEISEPHFIENTYKLFSRSYYITYLKHFSGHSKLFSVMDRIFFHNYFVKLKYNKKRLLAIQNYVECEAHREIMLEGIKVEIREHRT